MEGDIHNVHAQAHGAPSATAQRVLDAAVDLLRATGQLSMRKLAQSANVAGMTPYNLFGSKQGLLSALSENELALVIRRVDRTPVADSLDRVFAALDVAFETFSADEDYFRALYSAAYASSQPSLIAIFQSPRTIYWNSLLDAARDQGFLTKNTRSDTLVQILMYTYIGAVQRWIAMIITTRQLYAETNYVLMILLLSHATPKARDRIQRRLRTWEAFLHDKSAA
jgi:AcrR family transcriptional regulator